MSLMARRHGQSAHVVLITTEPCEKHDEVLKVIVHSRYLAPREVLPFGPRLCVVCLAEENDKLKEQLAQFAEWACS